MRDVPARPRALFLTHEPPLPQISGTRVRSFNLMRQLAERGWGVSLMTLTSSPDPDELERDGRAELEALCEEVVFEPFQRGPRELSALALAAARGRAFQSRYFYSGPAAARLEKVIERGESDLIVAGQLYMYPYLPAAWRDRTVLDCHNVELQRVERIATTGGTRARRRIASLQRRAVGRMEASALQSVAAALAVSEIDLAELERHAPGRVTLVPNGVDCERILPRTELPVSGLLFVGAMDYGANSDAVIHMIDRILPLLDEREPRLSVVGPNPPDSVRDAAQRAPIPVEVTGRVPSTEPSFEANRILVVPLRVGGGTRLKILEALARGVPVVTTPLGCEGIGLEHERTAIIAEYPRDFAAGIDRLMADDELCLRLAAAGREFVQERFDWRSIGAVLDGRMRSLLGGRR